MEKTWRLILDQAHEPNMNMAIDEAIMLCQIRKTSLPTLRFYRWLYPCLSIGKFQDPESICEWKDDLFIVRRPTGGGIVYHNEFSFTYSIVYKESSLVLPQGILSSYKQIHLGILQGLKRLGIDAQVYMPEDTSLKTPPTNNCFSSPVMFDIIYNDKKIAGAAQRRKFGTVLHQGEIRIGLDAWLKWSYNILKNVIISGLSKQLEAKFVEDCLSEEEKRTSEELAKKYEILTIPLLRRTLDHYKEVKI